MSLHNDPNPEVSDTTGDAMCTNARNIKKYITIPALNNNNGNQAFLR